MNMLTQLNHDMQMMSSLEIAELVQSRHDVVKKSIERLVNDGAIIQPPLVDEQTIDSMGRSRTVQVYLFKGEQGKLDSITTVAQLSPRFTSALVKRWYELENQNAVRLPQSFAEALQLAADQAKQLELQAPKVSFYDNLADRKTLMTATQLGQKFGKSAKALNKILEQFSVYNRCVKRGRVFQQWFIDQGLGELKETELGHSQALFTPKGEQWVFSQFSSEGLV